MNAEAASMGAATHDETLYPGRVDALYVHQVAVFVMHRHQQIASTHRKRFLPLAFFVIPKARTAGPG